MGWSAPIAVGGSAVLCAICALASCSTFSGGDAAAPADATADDAAPDSEDFCASQADARFCDDFRVRPAVPPWDSVSATNGGSVALASAPSEYRSAPSSLEIRLAADAGGPGATAYAGARLIGGVTDIECRFAMNPVKPDPTGQEAIVFSLQTGGTFFASVNGHELVWLIRLDGGRVNESTFPRDGGSSVGVLGQVGALPTNAWTQVVVAVHYVDGAGTFTLKLDGAPVLEKAIRSPYPNTLQAVTLGNPVASPGDWRILYDDFACTTR